MEVTVLTNPRATFGSYVKAKNLQGVDLKNGDGLKTGKWFRKEVSTDESSKNARELVEVVYLTSGSYFFFEI